MARADIEFTAVKEERDGKRVFVLTWEMGGASTTSFVGQKELLIDPEAWFRRAHLAAVHVLLPLAYGAHWRKFYPCDPSPPRANVDKFVRFVRGD